MLKLTGYSSQQIQESVLATLFASAARVAVLRVFLLDPMRSYYQRQLEAITGLPIRAIQREVDRLTSVGLLYRWAEGNRAYYQVDREFALFGELRGMILKIVTHLEVLRATLAVDPTVRLAFLSEGEDRVLVVTKGDASPTLSATDSVTVEPMTSEAFTEALGTNDTQLAPFLVRGVDLLGRREDIIWRRIEAAGYVVKKGSGVP